MCVRERERADTGMFSPFYQGMNTWLRGNKKMTNGECVSYDNILNDKQTYGWAGALQRQMQRSQYCIQYSRPLQITWMLLLMLCLVGMY